MNVRKICMIVGWQVFLPTVTIFVSKCLKISSFIHRYIILSRRIFYLPDEKKILIPSIDIREF